MIFVTVGTDQPFDRLVRSLDEWAEKNGRTDVFAQIGETKFVPRHLKSVHFLEAPEYQQHFANASVVISHAGMGTILTALRHKKPILVMPRRASLGEHRNEHQLATATHLLELGKISVAFDETELFARLANLEAMGARDAIGPYASPQLITALRQFIHEGHIPAQPTNATNGHLREHS